ncbi:caffeoylshikimate esterase isoform X1 [Elaeis guineensis]|uniref:Caffeoylshikimate esterase isoform X1 n=2 Tax=Elaeis guineensis var. tenera TaxID=51953 RepID=A0A6I9QWJ0_ELAGV|nr:caffeoylshikimate esterase isoform X1 [Elaeis guineensis]
MVSKPPAFANLFRPPPTHDYIRVGISFDQHQKKKKKKQPPAKEEEEGGGGGRGRVAAAVPPMTAVTRWEGVDDRLAKMITEANLDQAPERRRVREAFKDVQLGIDHCLFKAQYSGVIMKESYEVNSRGLEIFSKSWLPEGSKMKALICFCHGYGDTCTFFFEGIAKKLATSGYGVFALDYPGFGLSEGLHGYIPSFDTLVNDVAEHFSKIKENSEYQGLPSFLFGQSLGGAVALKVHLKQLHAWDGAILVAPMCKMAEDVVPAWPIQQILICIAKILPKEKLVPQKDLAEMAFKDIKKREQCSYNVIAYKDKPRLRTALELLRTTQEIERRLEEVSLPLIILHGEADIVTDPSVSKALYEKARSLDKKLCLYKDAYHSLLEGESDEMIFKVLNDIISWLDEHSVRRVSS